MRRSSFRRRRELARLVAANIQRECAVRGIDVYELGYRLSGDRSLTRQRARGVAYDKLRADKRACPALETLERMATAIGCSPLDLLPWGNP